MSKVCWKVLFTEKNVDNKGAIAFYQLGLLSCLASSSQGFMICPASEADTFLTSELTAPQLLGSHLCWFHSSWQSGWSRFFSKLFFENSFCKKLAFFNDKRVFHYAIHMRDSSSRMGHFWLREECTSTVVHRALRTFVLGLSGLPAGMWECGAGARILSVWVLTGLQLQ